MLAPLHGLRLLPLLLGVGRLGAERIQKEDAAERGCQQRPRWQTSQAIVAPTWEAFFDAADGAAPCESSFVQSQTSPPNFLKFFKPFRITRPATFAGGGAFGDVELMHLQCAGCSGVSCPNGTPKPEFSVAVKQQWYEDEKSRDRIFRERDLMRDVFTGRPFPKFMDIEEVKDKETVFLTMEAAKGDLSKVKGKPFSDKARLFADAMYGVKEIHRLGYIHRDLKPQNIFLSWDQKHALIGDFGLAIHEGDSTESEAVGTPAYLAPEVYKTSTYSTKQDVWAMGVVLYELIFQKKPEVFFDVFVEKKRSLLYDFDVTEDSRFAGLSGWVAEQELPGDTDEAELVEDIQQLLVGMLEADPEARIDAAEALVQATAISQKLGNTGDVAGGFAKRRVEGEDLCDKYRLHHNRF